MDLKTARAFSPQSVREQCWPRCEPDSASIAVLMVSCASRRTLAWPRGLPRSSSASKNWGGGRQALRRESTRGRPAHLRRKVKRLRCVVVVHCNEPKPRKDEVFGCGAKSQRTRV